MLSMSYSIDYRRRVVEFVKQGGSKLEASRIFNISRATIYNWLGRSDLAPKARGQCDRKLKKSELAAHIEKFPDAFLRERASHFGVKPSTVCIAVKKLRISKKNDKIRVLKQSLNTE
jgi:putative transposase